MKRCSYCGAENPDDATVCRIDQKQFETTRPVPAIKPARPKPSRAEVLAHLAARPWEVKFAVGLMALDLSFVIIKEIIYWAHSWHYFKFHHLDVYSLVCGYGINAWLVYCIYLARNWARWLISCLLILANISIPFTYVGHLPWDFYISLLIEMTAVVALFQRPSNEWYKGPKIISAQPEPAPDASPSFG